MTTENMTTMTVKELRTIAKDAGIVGIYKMKKSELITAINDSTVEKDVPAENTDGRIILNNPHEDSEFKVFGSKKNNILWNVAMNQKIELIHLSNSDTISLLENGEKMLTSSDVEMVFDDFNSAVKYLRDNDLGDRWWAARSLNDQVPMTNGVKLDEDVTMTTIDKHSKRMHFENNGTYMLNYVK